MNLDETFNLITKSFSNVVNNFSALNITKEFDWERHLYVEMRKNLGDKIFNLYIIHLESGAFKHGNGILWISPNTYTKSQFLVDEFFEVQTDEGGHYKLNLTKNLKPLSTPIKKFIESEKGRWAYIDIVIYDKKAKRSLAYIELKCGNNLSKEIVLQDFYKLKRLESVRSFPAIYIAVGYDPLNNKIFWLPTNSDHNYSFIFTGSGTDTTVLNRPAEFLNKDALIPKINTVSKNLYENTHASEAVWSAEIMYALQPLLPKDWHINSEISLPENIGGRIDLGIFDQHNNLNTAIEIKNHFEGQIPPELLNALSTDKSLQDDFYNQTMDFIAAYNQNQVMIKSRSSFPKNKAGYYLNADFFEKIIEIYNQYKRLAELIHLKKLNQGFMIFIDHSDDYSIRKKTHSIPEQAFLNNFKFRKELIKKILVPVKSDNFHFIYMYKLNCKNDVKKLYFNFD